ncbi:alkyl hydroperoxide reductase/ Thiol specific antioxidant/ Mal allergen [Alkalidesulfovibrio alkalitolerans DSM 16529]|uniref:Alkyl hydroperoxide reductase/ Thiol specific antioxidant/ Mal allergen n=1 Tax=Alkalidesulfovibrio alkalitolerans DSM 16529 TaxID=1121439 RepID=S7ULY3_9BACT|nr:TlpA disulfide reductase family protein [Alkalidesulfovibrio alkalitolerans]EPR34919.1 alkyl hydroperoxide reductase/ Thiol specific antioxidant/ Mal allergen [Alkalidesulfovibrio alkalitolerans DSM 16529]
MSRMIAFRLALACGLVLLTASLVLALPPAGKSFPALDLAAPDREADLDYLGLPKDAPTYRIEDVDAPFVLVQFFNVYCMHCQAEAPDVQKLFAAVSDGDLAEKLKMTSVAMGNTAFEIRVFREKYGLTLPMSTDESFAAHKALGAPGTPAYVLVRNPKDKGGRATVLFSGEGRFVSWEKFLDTVRSKVKEE